MLFKEHQANVILKSGAVGIKAGDKTKLETTAAIQYKVDGTLYPTLASATQLAALTGSIPDDYQAVYTFYVTFNEVTAQPVLSVDKSENFHISTYLKFKDFVVNDGDKAPIAYAVVKNETGSTFDGNVNELDESGITITVINANGFVGV